VNTVLGGPVWLQTTTTADLPVWWLIRICRQTINLQFLLAHSNNSCWPLKALEQIDIHFIIYKLEQ